MPIHVDFDHGKRQFTIRDDQNPIATLPLVYLEGRRAAYLTAQDIAGAFADAFTQAPKPATAREGRERALRRLGLLT